MQKFKPHELDHQECISMYFAPLMPWAYKIPMDAWSSYIVTVQLSDWRICFSSVSMHSFVCYKNFFMNDDQILKTFLAFMNFLA